MPEIDITKPPRVHRRRHGRFNTWEFDNFIGLVTNREGYSVSQIREALREIVEDDELWELFESLRENEEGRQVIRTKVEKRIVEARGRLKRHRRHGRKGVEAA